MYANNIPIALHIYITKIFVYFFNGQLIVGYCSCAKLLRVDINNYSIKFSYPLIQCYNTVEIFIIKFFNIRRVKKLLPHLFTLLQTPIFFFFLQRCTNVKKYVSYDKSNFFAFRILLKNELHNYFISPLNKFCKLWFF